MILRHYWCATDPTNSLIFIIVSSSSSIKLSLIVCKPNVGSWPVNKLVGTCMILRIKLWCPLSFLVPLAIFSSTMAKTSSFRAGVTKICCKAAKVGASSSLPFRNTTWAMGGKADGQLCVESSLFVCLKTHNFDPMYKLFGYFLVEHIWKYRYFQKHLKRKYNGNYLIINTLNTFRSDTIYYCSWHLLGFYLSKTQRYAFFNILNLGRTLFVHILRNQKSWFFPRNR